MLARIKVPPPPQDAFFDCVAQPPTDLPADDTRWYVVGFWYDEQRRFLRTIGFGIGVVALSGDVVGYGLGRFLCCIHGALGAEALALLQIAVVAPLRNQCKKQKNSARFLGAAPSFGNQCI